MNEVLFLWQVSKSDFGNKNTWTPAQLLNCSKFLVSGSLREATCVSAHQILPVSGSDLLQYTRVISNYRSKINNSWGFPDPSA